MPRRGWCGWWLALCLGLPVACLAQVSDSIRLVVPVAPGGNIDAVARLIAPLLARRLATAVVVDNKPGANTQIGSEWVARAPADGRTLLIVGVSHSINAALYGQKVDLADQLRPVTQLTRERLVLAVRANLPVQSLKQLASLPAEQVDRLNCGAFPGTGAMGCGLLASRLRGTMVNIPFNGTAATLNNLLGGQVDLAFLPAEGALQQVPAGRLRILAVASQDRVVDGPLAPYPRMVDVWPDFLIDGYLGLLVARKTPDAVVDRLNEAVNFALADPQVRERLAAMQHVVVGGSAEQFEQHISERRSYFKHLIEVAHIQAP